MDSRKKDEIVNFLISAIFVLGFELDDSSKPQIII